MKDDYLTCYQTLEIPAGCTWAQLRAAYRRRVRKWHPDRFQLEPAKKALAEEKIKEINKAYELLSSYHDKHGHLPTSVTVNEPLLPHSSPDRSLRPERRPPESYRTDVFAADWPSHETANVATKPYRIIRLVLIGFAIWLAYTFWWAPTPDTGSVSFVPPRSFALSPADSSGSGSVTEATKIQDGPHGFFTVGSTPDEVQAVEGIPTRITDGVWYYGKSRIYFDDGTVARWVDDPSTPLRVDSDSLESATPLTTFSVGSTKAQVRSIQGKPLLETDLEWSYGVSKVYFKGNRVSGWYSSPFEPLKISQ